MADRYWVGGSGNWDATSTANWSTSSGGSAGASAPTSADNVIFDANSNVGTGAFTVTVTGTVSAPSVCNDFSTGGAGGALDGAMTLTLGATAALDCYGSMTLPASNLTWSSTSGSGLNFRATTTGKTVTTNGVSLGATIVTFDGAGGEWTLGSALTIVGLSVIVTRGSFVTGNYSISAAGLSSTNSNVRSISLGSSTLTLTGSVGVVNTATTTNLTFNAGTSTITCSATNPTFAGGGLTFYNVSFTGAAAGTTTINGVNTFNDLTFTSRNVDGIRGVALGANQTVNGTLTFGATNTAVRRIRVQSDTVGTQRTITLNGTLATLADVDFRDINAAGTVSTPWTGTRLGNALGNSNITFDAPKTVYWNLAGSQNWSATGWATTNNGTPAVNNFPLPQDTATFTEAGAAGTVTINANWSIGSIQMADGVSNRTTAFTLATGTTTPQIFGNVTLFSNLTLSGTGIISLQGQGTTQTITSAGVSFTQPITIESPSGTVQLLDNTTVSNTVTLTAGTLDLSSGNRTLTCNIFSSSNSNTRSILFGTGNITLTGNNASIFVTTTATNLSYTGTPTINATYSGSVGTRTLTTSGQTETNAFDFNISAGTDIVAISNSRNLNFTGFAGSLSSSIRSIFGNLTISSGMTITAGANATTFAATSGTQQITTNGTVVDFAIVQNNPGATLQLQDNLTIGSTRTFTLTAGTLDLSNGNRTLSTGIFSSSNSNVRSIAFGTGNITITQNNATVWTTATATNFSYTGTPTVNLTYAGSTGTRTILSASTTGISETTVPSFNITAGSDTITMISAFKSVNFTGFTGTLTNALMTFYGDLTFSSGMTLSAGANSNIFAATSGTQQVTTNGKTLDFPITINGVGGTVRLEDNLTVPIGKTFTLTNGTLNINGKVLSVGNFSTSNSNARTIAFGTNGELTVLGVGTTAFNAGTSTNLTITGTNAKINMSGATAKTFAGGGFTYPLTLVQSGLGDLTLTGANTFTNMTNTVQPCTIIFPASTTTSFSNFNVNGTAGNLVSLRSSTPGTRCVLAKV